MSLTKGVDSFVSIVEADAYFRNRLETSEWATMALEDKERYLKTATELLYDKSWRGYAVDDNFVFPRIGDYYDSTLGKTVLLDGIPRRLIKATCELALHLLNNPGVLVEEETVQELTLDGVVTLKGVKRTVKIPPIITNLIRPLLNTDGSGGGTLLWWRAN